jgi:hypothetical protein
MLVVITSVSSRNRSYFDELGHAPSYSTNIEIKIFVLWFVERICLTHPAPLPTLYFLLGSTRRGTCPISRLISSCSLNQTELSFYRLRDHYVFACIADRWQSGENDASFPIKSVELHIYLHVICAVVIVAWILPVWKLRGCSERRSISSRFVVSIIIFVTCNSSS